MNAPGTRLFPGTPPSARTTERYLGHLDALRGIAILGVILVHSAFLSQQGYRILTLCFAGQRGVQLFYMISAFTLCLSLDSARREHHPLTNFFLRRFFRIAPLFYIVLMVNLLLNWVAPAYSPLHALSHLDVALGFLFLNGLRPRAINSVVGGGWSIAVETTFYVCLPFLFRYFNTVRRTFLLFAFSAPILGVLSSILAHRSTPGETQVYFSFFWFPVEFPVFVLGMLTYYIWKEHIQGQVKGSRKQKQISLFLILTSFMIFCASLPFTDAKLYFSSFLFLPLILALSIFAWPLLVNSFTRFIGKISYSLYLIHSFALQIVGSVLIRWNTSPAHPVSNHIFRHPMGLVPVFLGTLVLSIAISLFTWKFIEQPGIRLGRNLIAYLEGRRNTAANLPLVPSLHALESRQSTPDAQF